VIDIASRKVTGSIDFGHGVRPHCVLIGPKDGMLYVTTERWWRRRSCAGLRTSVPGISTSFSPRAPGAVQVMANVFGELLYGCVAAVRLFAQRHQNDFVEITGQLAMQS
jgi:hypothetical protein